MPSRVVPFLLAFLLLWSGFTTQERAVSFASSNVEQADVGLAGELQQRVHEGSVEDHHLDDQPAQAQTESVMDLQALFPARVDEPAFALTMARPRPYAVTTWLEPYLEGPQRPPCATRLAV